MDIICEHCHAKLSIVDNKIPKGKNVSFLCPKCKGKIHIVKQDADSGGSNTEHNSNAGVMDADQGNIGETVDYDAADKPFDFLEENEKTALICIRDGAQRKKFEHAFEKMEYNTVSADYSATALTRMKYHLFDCIILSDNFDGNHRGASAVLSYMQGLSMEIRRRIFAVLVSEKYHTADNMAAFHKSVNLIINEKDISNINKIFSRTIREHEKFYSVFNDSIKNAGRV